MIDNFKELNRQKMRLKLDCDEAIYRLGSFTRQDLGDVNKDFL